VTNSNPYLPTYRSGFTGPSERIGGSSPYHIDLKILSNLPLSEKIRALDSLAAQYKSIGREIEFSNQAVSGRRWNPNATPEEKKALFEAASAAHRPRPGWDPLDFYVPFAGKSRFDQGAVEGASIFIPGVPGGKITRGSGGGYGYFSEALDPSGRVVFRVGHGDINRPEEQGEVLVEAGKTPIPADTATNGTKTADDLLLEKLAEILNPKQGITIPKYQGPSEDQFKKTAEAIDEATMKLLAESMKEKEAQQAPVYAPSTAGPMAAAMAQKGFLTPKSTI
jgi:hypothetical protein